MTRLNIKVTTSEGDVVTIVKTGELLDRHGNLLTLIDDNDNAYPVAVTDGANFQCILSDLSGVDGLYLPQSYPHICVISRNGDDYEPINPQLLPLLASLGMDFNAGSYHLQLKSANGTTLDNYVSNTCINAPGGTSVYIEHWENEQSGPGAGDPFQFSNPDNDRPLLCDKSAFAGNEADAKAIYAMRFDVEPANYDNWKWKNLASWYLEAKGVSPDIIPVYQP